MSTCLLVKKYSLYCIKNLIKFGDLTKNNNKSWSQGNPGAVLLMCKGVEYYQRLERVHEKKKVDVGVEYLQFLDGTLPAESQLVVNFKILSCRAMTKRCLRTENLYICILFIQC